MSLKYIRCASYRMFFCFLMHFVLISNHHSNLLQMHKEDGSMSEALHCFPVNPDGTFEVKGVNGIMEVVDLMLPVMMTVFPLFLLRMYTLYPQFWYLWL